jgi:hypothetical protein
MPSFTQKNRRFRKRKMKGGYIRQKPTKKSSQNNKSTKTRTRLGTRTRTRTKYPKFAKSARELRTNTMTMY